MVKAFNNVGFPVMANSQFGTRAAAMLICDNDAKAKGVVKQLSDELEFETMDAGLLNIARFPEHFTMLWIHLCVGLAWGLDLAFQVVRR